MTLLEARQKFYEVPFSSLIVTAVHPTSTLHHSDQPSSLLFCLKFTATDAAGTMNDRPVVCVLYVPSQLIRFWMCSLQSPSCGASEGTSPAHMAAARSLAHALYSNGLRLVGSTLILLPLLM
jgi:hypothetical protein